MKSLSPVGLPALAVALNATSPDPGYRSVIWSTTTGGPLFWDGSKWAAVASSGGGLDGEGVDDRVSTLLVAGAGVGITYDDSPALTTLEFASGIPAVMSSAATAAGWNVVTEATYPDGTRTKSLRSPVIGNSVTNFFEFTVNLAAATNNFTIRYRVSSEATYDTFRVFANGTQLLVSSGVNTTYTEQTFSLSAGSTTIKIQYAKDSSATSGEDAAFVSLIAYKAVTAGDIPGQLTIAAKTPAPVTVTYAASTTIDVTGQPDGRIHRITLTGNLTLGFTGGVDGQKVLVELIQDATGSRIVTMGSSVAYGTDISAFAATTTPSKKDVLGFIYSSAAAKYLLVAVAKGY